MYCVQGNSCVDLKVMSGIKNIFGTHTHTHTQGQCRACKVKGTEPEELCIIHIHYLVYLFNNPVNWVLSCPFSPESIDQTTRGIFQLSPCDPMSSLLTCESHTYYMRSTCCAKACGESLNATMKTFFFHCQIMQHLKHGLK